jgi:hypothetical protein
MNLNNKHKEIFKIIDSLLGQEVTVSELSDQKIRAVARYIFSTHRKHLQMLEAVHRQELELTPQLEATA